MKIQSIKIENFRSIKHADITVDKFNVFVGQNNHGKTNFFEAIDWFYTGKGDLEKIRFGRHGAAEILVEIEFSEIKDGILKMKNEKNQTTIQKLVGENDTVKIKRSSLDPKNRKIFDAVNNEWTVKNPSGFDSALNDFLPKFEYVSTQENPLEMTKYGKNTPIANMLSGVLNVILEQDEVYANFRKQFDTLFTDPKSEVRIKLDDLSGKVKVYLEKQFPDCNKVVFEVAEPVFEDLLKKFDTGIDDGVYTDAIEKGDGMQRALMLAIIQAYADFRRQNEETSKYFLFFIDEGELHLHPTAQRKLKNALLELATEGDQVFLNTHSSVLVAEEEEIQTVFKVQKLKKETTISKVELFEKPSIVFELLGGSPADLLLPKNFLIIEGKCEQEFITKIISRHYSEKPNIQLVPANGDLVETKRTLNAVLHVFKPLETSIYKEKVVIYIDKQNSAQEEQLKTFLTSHPKLSANGQFFESSVCNIEEYYPVPYRKTNTEVKIMTSNEKLDLAKAASEKITKDEFEKNMPELYKALTSCWEKTFE